MTTTLRRTAALLAPTTALPLALGLLAAPAQAADREPARITASVTDATPGTGQTFHVAGRLTRDGDPVAGRTVRVQARRDGGWENLTGARMTTSSQGGYDLRLVLGQRGYRTLRVLARLPGRNAAHRFTVTVH